MHTFISDYVVLFSVNYVYSVLKKPHIGKLLPLNVVIDAGEEYSIECNASGNPSPVITWYKDDSEMAANDKK